ncbi:uncharacterized protein TM35_000014160 [Trypanosoma theileri]|uniref:F-box domain-containing protein n=1 Tax=Trypanosoma theileri TaxID=67003 RepID=A0A1X0PAB9_9TRYP|nr:uncharacterized protein TM35_000014160 [Trypanosoma theileri]ORC93539.1 hypothetical protein TM35_000014160 [Trypanosoma theileri]
MFQLQKDDAHFGVRITTKHNHNNTHRMREDDNKTPPPRTRRTRAEAAAATTTRATAIETEATNIDIEVAAINQSGIPHLAGSGAHVPLRSRTVIGPRLQLRTYHDNSEVRAALERLKQSCGASSLNEAEELMTLRHIHDGSDPTWSQLNRIPGHVILYCFSFCDMHSLSVLSCVNRRLSALANAHHLWEAHARRLGVPLRDARHAREDIRLALQQREEREEAEVRRHEDEYEELERRLVERTAANRALPLDVDAALLTARNRVPPITSSGRNRPNNSNNNNNSGNRRTLAEERALREQLDQIETTKLNILRTITELQSTLATHEQQIQQIQQRLDISQRGETENDSTGLSDSLTLADVQSFERRVCHVLLNPVSDLPLVLRRGIDDFSTMELLCLYGGGDVGQLVRQRWAAFKRFFPPLSRDYVAVRQALLLPPSSSNSNNQTPSARLRESFERIAGVIRRVQMMTDSEIVQITM